MVTHRGDQEGISLGRLHWCWARAEGSAVQSRGRLAPRASVAVVDINNEADDKTAAAIADIDGAPLSLQWDLADPGATPPNLP
jgi:hypothetical protein